MDFQFLNDLNTGLQRIQQTLAALVEQAGQTFVQVGGNNIFTGLNQFNQPPLIIAGTGTGYFQPMGVLSSQFSVAGIGNTATTSDVTLFSYALPANSLDANGAGVLIEAWGSFAANGNDKRVRLALGASAFSSGTQTGNNVGWQARAVFTRTGASAQIGTGWGQSGATVWTVPTPITPASDTTAAITLAVTGASLTTGAANDVVANGFVVSMLNYG